MLTDLRIANSSFRSIHESNTQRESLDGRFDVGDRGYGMYDKRENGITRVRDINVDILISILIILSMQGLIQWSATQSSNKLISRY